LAWGPKKIKQKGNYLSVSSFSCLFEKLKEFFFIDCTFKCSVHVFLLSFLGFFDHVLSISFADQERN